MSARKRVEQSPRPQPARAKLAGAGRVQLGSTVILLGSTALLALFPTLFGSEHIPTMFGPLSVLVFAYAWHPVAGILGELSLAHLVSWGAGGYALVKTLNAGWDLVPALFVSACVGAAIAGAVVLFATAARLEGLYLFVFTLVAIHLAVAIAKDWDWLGSNIGIGLNVLPFTTEALYYVVVAYVALLFFINAVLLGSRRGLMWLAMRDDPERVAPLGLSHATQRLSAYTATGALCGIGGALHVAGTGYISPDSGMSLPLVVVALLAIYVGGPGTLVGPLLGVALLEGLSTAAESAGSEADTAQWAILLQYSTALIIVTLLMYVQRRRKTEAMVKAARAAAERVGPAELEARFTPPAIATSWSRAGSPLAVESLEKSFGGLRVLEGVSFKVGEGEVLGLVGPNGAGKSTICNIISGTVRPDDGRIWLGDQDASTMPSHHRSRFGLGRTYQTPRVFSSLTLAENVQVANGRTSIRQAERLLETLGVAGPRKLGEHASLLERRMVEIARLIVMQPRWVIMDEPLAGLSKEMHALIVGAVTEMASRGVSVLMIEHLIPSILPATHRLVVLSGGRLIADGEPSRVLRDRNVVDAYLGEATLADGGPR